MLNPTKTMRTDPDAQAMQAALEPCPFCGCTDIFIEPDERGSGGQWVAPIHVGCTSCKAEQRGDDQDEATANWNRRATLRSRLAEGVEAKPNHVGDANEMIEVDAWRVEWKRQEKHGEETWVQADANEVRARELAAHHGGTCIPCYRTPPTHTAAVQAERERAAKVAGELADGLKQEGDSWAKLGSKVDAADSYLLANLAGKIAVYIRTGWKTDEIEGGKR